MFISSKDILQYVAWCITVHALIVSINDDISIYLFEDNSVAYCIFMAFWITENRQYKLPIKIPQHFFRYKYFGATCFPLNNKIDCVYGTNVSLIPEWELRVLWAEKVLETSIRCSKMPKTGITANLIASQDSSEESFSCVIKQAISWISRNVIQHQQEPAEWDPAAAE